MHYDYVIVGAGLYGAVFAHEMKEQGKKCLVLEKRKHIGGNAYTKRVEGVDVHWYGAHIFHTSNKRVWNYVNQFAEFNHYVNSPIVIYRDELYNMPFNMNTFSKMWGVRTPEEARAKIEEQKKECAVAEPQNLEEQALSLVGRDIYEKLIKGYTQKQWGRDCKELPAFIIKRVPLRFTYNNNYFNDPYQGIPVDGYTALVERLLDGIPLRLGTGWQQYREEQQAKREGRLAGKADTWDMLLYTGMIDEYYDYCFGELAYRSLRFVHEVIKDCDNWQGNAVMNYTEGKVPYTRIIEHKHFTFGTGAGTVITREYPEPWKRGDEPYYPINDEANTVLYEKYRALAAQEQGVIFGGRLGQYKYYDMDKVVEEALKLAEQKIPLV